MMTLTALTSPRSGLRPDARGRFLRVVAGLFVAASGTFFSTGAGATGAAATTINEASNGHVITVSLGAHLTAILHSTYWSFDPLSGNVVLVQVGTTKTVPQLKRCVPGQGCGTVTAHFVARGTGRVRLHANRTSCGEALRCTPSQSHWTVVIRVR
jgi:hypothetical protein